jgi:hypothetical protein
MMSKKKKDRNKLDVLETHLRHLEEHKRVLEQREADSLVSKIPASRLHQVEELFNSGLMSYEDIRRLFDFPTSYEIEAKVQTVKVNGREVLEWVV